MSEVYVDRYKYRLSLGKVYEYRHYYATPGNTKAMHQSYEDDILRIWARHGIKLVGFWVPTFGGFTDELIYINEWESLEERDRVWKSFLEDPEWQEIWKEKDKNGALHARIHTELWRSAPYAPDPCATLAAVRQERLGMGDKLYEYRRYTGTPGNLDAQQAHFEAFVLPMFARHGIKLVGFWVPTFGGFTDELIYINEWESLEERDRVWKSFLEDPEWQEIWKEKDKNGALTARIHTELWRSAPYAGAPHLVTQKD